MFDVNYNVDMLSNWVVVFSNLELIVILDMCKLNLPSGKTNKIKPNNINPARQYKPKRQKKSSNTM